LNLGQNSQDQDISYGSGSADAQFSLTDPDPGDLLITDSPDPELYFQATFSL